MRWTTSSAASSSTQRPTPDTGARLESLWLRVLNRPITSSERKDALVLLDSVRFTSAKDIELAAWIELSHALLSSNEFLLRL